MPLYRYKYAPKAKRESLGENKPQQETKTPGERPLHKMKPPQRKDMPKAPNKNLLGEGATPQNINAYTFHIVTSNYKQLKTNYFSLAIYIHNKIENQRVTYLSLNAFSNVRVLLLQAAPAPACRPQ
jgi:hypothetical protein